MAIKDVLEAANLMSEAMEGQEIEKSLLSKFRPNDSAYKKAVCELNKSEFEKLAVYRSSQTLAIGSLKDEDAANILPNSIERARKQICKETGRQG